MTDPAQEHGYSAKVWDLPVRVSHWGFALLIPAMWWTAESDAMEWHLRLGMVLLGLLVFRVCWGFVGSSTARFASFVRGPGAVIAYLRGAKAQHIGHNAAGGWSVVVLLGLMLAQVGLGLFAGDIDDGATGPLNHLASYAAADRATGLHEALFNVLAGFILLHLGAIAFYRLVKREDIVTPMVTGNRVYPAVVEGMRRAGGMRLLACMAGSATAVWWVWVGAPLPGSA